MSLRPAAAPVAAPVAGGGGDRLRAVLAVGHAEAARRQEYEGDIGWPFWKKKKEPPPPDGTRGPHEDINEAMKDLRSKVNAFGDFEAWYRTRQSATGKGKVFHVTAQNSGDNKMYVQLRSATKRWSNEGKYPFTPKTGKLPEFLHFVSRAALLVREDYFDAQEQGLLAALPDRND